MELGGNHNAHAYLKKINKDTFDGYKNEQSKKYENALMKRVSDKLKEEKIDVVHIDNNVDTIIHNDIHTIDNTNIDGIHIDKQEKDNNNSYKTKKIAVSFNTKYL